MDSRVKQLEDFQNKWKFYFWAIVVVGSLVTIMLGWNINQINEKLSSLNANLSKAEEHLQELHIKSNVAEIASNNALKQAGNLDDTLIESKSAYIKAAKSAEQSILSSQKAIAASENALKASQEARAISLTIDGKIRTLEKIIVDIETIKKSPDPSSKSTKPFEVEINGTNLDIRFEEGKSPYDSTIVNQSYYTGTIFVPENCIANVKGTVTYSNFLVTSGLKGRVIDNTSGNSNSWNQE